MSDGFVGAMEDDGNTELTVTTGTDTDGRWRSQSRTGTDTLTKTGVVSASYAERVSDTVSALSIADSDAFGSAVARRDNLLVVGSPRDDTNATNTGTVYLITDSDGDGDFSDTVSGDVTVIDGDTAWYHACRAR